MAIKDKADLQIVIDSNLPDNTIDFITPLLHREVEEDLKDSPFNKLDDPRSINFYINTSSTTSNIVATYGTVTIIGALRKSAKVLDTEYETSVDGGDTWVSHATFGVYQTFMLSATGTSFIYSRAKNPSFSVGFLGEQEVKVQFY